MIVEIATHGRRIIERVAGTAAAPAHCVVHLLASLSPAYAPP